MVKLLFFAVVRISKTLKKCFATLFLLVVLGVSNANAIDVVVDTASGEVFFKNSLISAVTVDGYQIDSLSGSLLPSNLGGVTGVLDLSGDMSLDENSDWFVITSSTNSIVEASLQELSGSLGPGEVVSLGELWNTGASQDLDIIVSAGASLSNATIEYLDLTGDYNSNGVVDELDYVEFFLNYGSMVDLDADGNGDGVVNAADYTVWRDAFELANVSLILSEIEDIQGQVIQFSSATAVPEPAAAMLFASTVVVFVCGRCR